MSQRWRERRAFYRPADDDRFEPARHEVVPVTSVEPYARPFVEGHHYSGTLPNSTRFAFLLLDMHRVVGVATFGSPSGPTVLESAFPFLGHGSREASELQRLVLLDSVRKNGESWFVARCFAALRDLDQEAVVSFSDPVARLDAEGNEVKPGHVGHVYQALGAWWTGRSKPSWTWVRRDGSPINRRDLTKVSASCPCCGTGNSTSGASGTVARLVGWGAVAPKSGECLHEWLEKALPTIACPRRHGGNHRYVWGLTRASKRGLQQLHGPVDHTVYPKASDP